MGERERSEWGRGKEERGGLPAAEVAAAVPGGRRGNGGEEEEWGRG